MNALNFFPVLAALAIIPSVTSAQATDDSTTLRTLTLGGAARLAAHQSAHALEAHARADQAKARLTQSRAQFLPNIDAAFTPASAKTYNTAPLLGFAFPVLPGETKPLFDANGQIVGPINEVTYGLRAADTLFSFGAVNRYRATESLERSQLADATQQEDSAASAAAVVYLRTQRAVADLGARIADSALAADLLGIAQNQLKAGTGILLDVTRAQSQLANERAQVIQARNDVDRAQLDLLRALGLPLSAPITLTDSLAALPISDTLPPEAASIDHALKHRPDLKAADAQLEAYERQVSAIRAERLPAISAVGSWAEDGIRYNALLPVFDAGLQVSFPIFDGFSRSGRVQEQQAAAHEVEIRRRDLRQRISIEVRQAYLDLASARQVVVAARERQTFAQQEVDQARDRFRSGVATNADVITALLDFDGAQTSLIDALNSYQTARVSLARALGAVQELP
jgi:outer membrane protein